MESLAPSRPLPQDRLFIQSRFLTVPGSRDGFRSPRILKNLWRVLSETPEVWVLSLVNSRVNLEGVDHAVAVSFVRFLYTNELDPELMEDSNALCHLLALAHRYEAQSVVESFLLLLRVFLPPRLLTS